MTKNHDLDEARSQAGFSVSRVCEICGITRRTWRRWVRHGGPGWAYQLIRCHAGHLDHLQGWKHWQIRQGRLYCGQLADRYHWDAPGLLATLYAELNASAKPILKAPRRA